MNSAAIINSINICRVSLDEQRYDLSFVEAPAVDETAAIKSVIDADSYGDLICEAMGESSQADIDAIREAFNTGDKLALGEALHLILTGYARKVAQANGNI